MERGVILCLIFLKKIISSFNKYSEITVAFAIVAIIGIIMIPMNSGGIGLFISY